MTLVYLVSKAFNLSVVTVPYEYRPTNLVNRLWKAENTIR